MLCSGFLHKTNVLARLMSVMLKEFKRIKIREISGIRRRMKNILGQKKSTFCHDFGSINKIIMKFEHNHYKYKKNQVVT